MSKSTTALARAQQQGLADASNPFALPKGARAFQEAVDGKLTPGIWSEILQAQIEKAKGGDRGAAQFLIEYAGGVQSFRGATFVQENHHHYHGTPAEAEAPEGEVVRRRPGRPRKESPASAAADSPERAKELGLSLLEILSPSTPSFLADLTGEDELDCTPQELEAAVIWLADQGIAIDEIKAEQDGLRRPALQLVPGQSQQIRKILNKHAAAAGRAA